MIVWRECTATRERIKIEEQLTMFQKRMGLFGRDTALATRKTKQPGIILFAFKFLLFFKYIYNIRK